MSPSLEYRDHTPQFVLVGISRSKDQVVILASRNLSNVRYSMGDGRFFDVDHLDVDMKDVVTFTGKSYDEAFAELFRRWSPTSDEQFAGADEVIPFGPALPGGEYFADKVYPMNEIEGGE